MDMSLCLRIPFAAIPLCITLVVGCSKATEQGASQTADRVEPPRLLTRGMAPELQDIASNAAGRPSLRVRIEVMVGPDGRADLRTLKLTDAGSMQNRIAIEQWLERVTFRPAMRDGQPVSGLWKSTFLVRVVVR
jgi:hypothetical protein